MCLPAFISTPSATLCLVMRDQVGLCRARHIFFSKQFLFYLNARFVHSLRRD